MNEDEIASMASAAGFSQHEGIIMGGLSDLSRFADLAVQRYIQQCEAELNEAIKEMQELGFGQP